ncbi:hypothetical protein PHYBOEH_002415 [Phytophthora boehmeriae]|uniref:BTB domain-containing protein n=1 Tax=Phytophthora boehmeriae TaxID=109152 RepID=A0A8T1X6E3_9STRA|nr:hypothetical protein PHYBOEH_002415 [Phytophthora boehmeriae]
MSRPKAAAAGKSLSVMAPGATTTRNVVIHVFDEYRKTSKEFQCQRDLLLSKMKYFQAYLNEANEHDEIDISVHCDVEVFELLMEYMHQRSHEWRPRITLENIAPILVSSEFLQMDELVEECVTFISSRVQDFMQLRVDFSCLSESTVAKIANNCTPEQLQNLHDPKDKILPKLRRKKVLALVKTLQENGRRLELCTNCEMLFITDDVECAGCPKGKRQIGVHGELVGQHQARTGWQIEVLLRELEADKNTSWSAAYWYFWGSTKYFTCSVCMQRIFSADEFSTRGCKTLAHVPIQDQNYPDVSSFSRITAHPNMWEMLHACTKVAKAQGAPTISDGGGGGRIDVSSVFASYSSRKPGPASEGNSSGYRRQCKILQLQEKDRLQSQDLARMLVAQRKKATS